MDFRILGPLEVYDDAGQPVELAPRQAALLALFLVHANEVLSTDRIIDALWGSSPPGNALNVLRFHINRLRSALEPDRAKGAPSERLPTAPPGYMLRVGPEELDMRSATKSLDRARRHMEQDDPGAALAEFESALALWRGPTLDEFTFEEWAQGPIAGLEELRFQAFEGQARALVRTGDYQSAIPLLEDLTSRHQGSEPLWVLLIEALIEAGRRPDASRAYDRARRRLVEVGLEPTSSLTDALDRILAPAPPGVVRTNIPARLTELVGREDTIERALGLLADTRLVTFTGSPGVGKTELALETARRAERVAGEWYVPLESLEDPGLIPRAILDAMQISESPMRDPLEQLAEHIHELDVLLLLDNCEHLVSGLTDLCGHLLMHCPELTILATSTINLGILGETTFRVGGLPYADGIRSPAVELFLRRARDVNANAQFTPRDIEAIALICARLEGNPLAIELATARLTALGPQDIEERLADRFRLLVDDNRAYPERRRSLIAIMGWSYDLLSPSDQDIVRALATFRGGFTLNAAKEVCDATETTTLSRLEHLIHASWVGSPVLGRFRMLETMRLYAAEETTTSEVEREALKTRHANYFVELADRARRDMYGPRSGEALAILGDEDANCRTAIEALLSLGRTADALHLVVSLGNYWFETARHGMARRMLRRTLEAFGDTPTIDTTQAWADLALHEVFAGGDPAASVGELRRHAEHTGDAMGLARLHRGQATVAWTHGDYVGAYDELVTAIELMDGADEGLLAQPLASVIRVAVWLGRTAEAATYLVDLTQLVQRRGTTLTRPLAQHCSAWLSLYEGDHRATLTACGEAIAGFSESGLVIYQLEALFVKAMGALLGEDDDTAYEAATSALELQTRFGLDNLMSDPHSVLARLAERRGEFESASREFVTSLEILTERGSEAPIMWSTFHLAGYLRRHQQPRAAAVLQGVARAIRIRRELALTVPGQATLLRELAALGQSLGDDKLEDALTEGESLDHEGALDIAKRACMAVAG